MNRDLTASGGAVNDAGADPAVLADLRLRLQSSQAQEQAARAETRRLARELALARRLLKFAFDGPPPLPRVETSEIRPAPATLLTARMIYHLDVCENLGATTAVSGWAFCPTDGWDARVATATLRLQHGDTTHLALCDRVLRPDVAALYAVQPAGESGGARGLEGAGFGCEIVHTSLPTGVELKVILRLECEGMACEQFTGQRLRF